MKNKIILFFLISFLHRVINAQITAEIYNQGQGLCGTYLYLISDSTFISMQGCEADIWYKYGSYKINADTLLLNNKNADELAKTKVSTENDTSLTQYEFTFVDPYGLYFDEALIAGIINPHTGNSVMLKYKPEKKCFTAPFGSEYMLEIYSASIFLNRHVFVNLYNLNGFTKATIQLNIPTLCIQKKSYPFTNKNAFDQDQFRSRLIFRDGNITSPDLTIKHADNLEKIFTATILDGKWVFVNLKKR